MIRLFTAIIFISAGTIAGISKSYSLKYKLELCRSIKLMLHEITIHIRTTGADVYQIAAELKKTKSLTQLEFIKVLPTRFEPDCDFREKWKSAINIQKDIPEEERKILQSIGEILGTSDIEGQLEVMKTFDSELGNIERTRREIFAQKGKLYRSVGMLFGVMAGILVI